MTTLAKFVQRASRWNADRYEQKFDLDLTINLVQEELKEYLSATDLVEQADALCDICFIASGALWKLKLEFDERTFDSFYNFYLLADFTIEEAIANVLHVARNYPGLYQHACTLHQLIAISFDLLSYKLASKEEALKALFIIADSNDTKSSKIIPINAKYSEEGKGLEYIPPTAALTQLIAGIANEVKH